MQALHSFYKAHNMPYLEEYAQFDTQQLNELFQPNIFDIQQEIENDDQKLENIYQQAKKRNIIGASLAAIVALGLYCYKI